jgi:hypothetical protein
MRSEPGTVVTGFLLSFQKRFILFHPSETKQPQNKTPKPWPEVILKK